MQKLQNKGKDERKQIYEQIKQIDEQMNQEQALIRQVRDKDMRQKFMETMVEFKQQVAAIFRVMG